MSMNLNSSNNLHNVEADDSFSESDFSEGSEDSQLWADEVDQNGELFYVENNDNIIAGLNNQQQENFISTQNTLDDAGFSLHGHQPTPLKNVHVNVKPAHYYADRRSSTFLESMLGIILVPGRIRQNNNIVISALIAHGAVMKSERVDIGDTLVALNDVPVSTNNIEQVLSSVPRAMQLKLTFTSKHSPSPVEPPEEVRTEREANSAVIKLLQNNDNVRNTVDELNDYRAVFFLSLAVDSETAAPEEDIKYMFPRLEGSSCIRKLQMMRGIFTTIADVVKDAFNSKALSSTFKVGDTMVHCGYFAVDNHVFLVCVNADKLSVTEIHALTARYVQLIKFMFGSLYRAFNKVNTSRLNVLFHLLLTVKAYKIPLLQEHPTELRMELQTRADIDAAVSEMEAGDFGDEYSTSVPQRLYVFAGSCMFYNGQLTCSHMNRNELNDVINFLTSFRIFEQANDQNSGQLIIWREVFPWLHVEEDEDEDGFDEKRGRCFLQIVGLRGYVLCSLLEVSGCCCQPVAYPGPNHLYVNLARSTILQLHSQGIADALNKKTITPTTPSIVSADIFVKKQSLFSNTSKPPPGNTSTPGSSGGGMKIPFKSLTRKSSKSDISKTVSSPQNSPGKTKRDASLRSGGSPKFRRDESQRSLTSNESPKTKKRPIAGFSLGDLKRAVTSTSTNRKLDVTKPTLLTHGKENTLLNYIHLDSISGILVMPNDEDYRLCDGIFLDVVSSKFEQCVKTIKQRFDVPSSTEQSISQCVEEGVMFQCHRSDQAKKTPLKFWVIGRRQQQPYLSETFVCFHDSAKQNTVEMAFKLGFSRPP